MRSRRSQQWWRAPRAHERPHCRPRRRTASPV
jgi:hypothetical protein